ncbi:MAG: TRAP transporter large permease subunit, partial [Candidatus Methylomirabilia bacterium]
LMAVHLFIMYWAMLSYITPPVAIGAYAAASIAQCNPMRAGLEAMRFGAVKYLLPFFFVFNPLLVAQNVTAGQFVLVFGGAILGIGLFAYALQGYLLGVGPLTNNVPGVLVRGLLVVAGVLLAAPEPFTDLIGVALAVATYGVLLGASRLRRNLLASPIGH